jgi:hypothetical protein
MVKTTIPIIFSLALLAMPTAAPAEPAGEVLCSGDRLGVNAAVQRTEWARRCALTTNTAGPDSWFLSTNAVDFTFNWAKDYREIDPDHAFSGSLFDYNVNYYHARARYAPTPVYAVSQETTGATAGFWKWLSTLQRPRPLYPSFETTPVGGQGVLLFPPPNLDDCNLYQRNPTTGELSRWTGNFYVVAYCLSP